MTRWIIEKSQGFTNVGLHRISESIRAYVYLMLSSEASARSSIVGNTVAALTTQKAFVNNFEDRRVDIQEDIKHNQDTLSYASSKVDYSVGENIYMLPGDMNLNIRSGTVGYNNNILISDGKFSLGKNDKVNALATPQRNRLTLMGYHSFMQRNQLSLIHRNKLSLMNRNQLSFIHRNKLSLMNRNQQSLMKMKKLPWYLL